MVQTITVDFVLTLFVLVGICCAIRLPFVVLLQLGSECVAEWWEEWRAIRRRLERRVKQGA